MPLNTTEKQFESDIAAALLSPAGGLHPKRGLLRPQAGTVCGYPDPLCAKDPAQRVGIF